MICNNCGKEPEDGMLFCRWCGYPVGENTAVKTDAAGKKKKSFDSGVKKSFFEKFGDAHSFVKNKWKNSTGKEKSLWLSMLVLGIYIISPVDLLPGVELDDIIAFIGLAGSYGLLTGQNRDGTYDDAIHMSEGEMVGRATKMARDYKRNKNNK